MILSRGGHEVQRQEIVSGQQYSFRIPAGEYGVTAKGVEGVCVPETVIISANTDNRKDLICSRK